MGNGNLDILKRYVNASAFELFFKASKHCAEVRSRAVEISDRCLEKCKIPKENICVVAVGSLGRREALEASDIDLIPVLADEAMVQPFSECDQLLRSALAKELSMKVSKGESLTRADAVSGFADSKLIGGESDSVTHLTKRVLVLTESVSVGGNLPIQTVREKILRGYSDMDRTRGRHVLSLVNDIARYFRTLCIEYKGKVDADGKDWCTRNLKLRYSRKLWYFANLVAIVSIAEKHPRGERDYEKQLLKVFGLPPYMRLVEESSDSHPVEVGHILECFSYFLEFMASPQRRDMLAKVSHEKRYAIENGNPFPALKHNSDLMHCYMVDLLNGMNISARRRVIDWFLL